MAKAKTPKAGTEMKVAKTPSNPTMKAVKEGDKFLILIVDDVADNRDIYADFLRFKGFNVEEATDGFQAVEKAQKLQPDVILMDLSLPGMDGWEASRRIKNNPDTRHIKIVAVTGHALEGTSDGARAAGCDGFLAKPCLPATLEAEIRRMLDPGKPAKTKARPKNS
jgi:CheY-like chemotaxis protein